MKESFTIDLKKVVLRKIAELEAGTVGIERSHLWQLVVSDALRLSSAPRGTSAAWVARQVFNSIVAEEPFKKFVYAEQ